MDRLELTLEGFLEALFSQIECFDWSGALGMIRRFNNPSSNALCKVLVNLVNCERIYYSMNFGSDNQLIVQYQKTNEDIEGFSSVYGEVYRSLLCHCVPLINSRKTILSVYYLFRDYEYQVPSSLARTVSFRQNPVVCKLLNQNLSAEVESQLQDLEEQLLRKYYQINHWMTPAFFAQVKRNLIQELNILRMALSARRHIHEMNYNDSSFSVFNLKIELKTWREQFGNTELVTSQPLYQWFQRYFKFLLGKMTLYFYKPLSEQHSLTRSTDDLSTLYNTKSFRPHFINMINTYCTKSSINHLSILLNYNKAIEDYGQCSLNGYEIPSSQESEVVSGLKSWPAIYSHPLNSSPGSHLPNLISILLDRKDSLDEHYFIVEYDRKMKVTYVVSIIEKYFYLIMIMNEKRKDIKNIKLFAAHFVSSLAMIAPPLKV